MTRPKPERAFVILEPRHDLNLSWELHLNILCLRLGAQPAWHPRQWPTIYSHHASLRAQLNRARNKAVMITEWPAEQAYGHAELHRCLGEWLSTRGSPPMHFLIEPQTLERLFDLLVASLSRKDRERLLVFSLPRPCHNEMAG